MKRILSILLTLLLVLTLLAACQSGSDRETPSGENAPESAAPTEALTAQDIAASAIAHLLAADSFCPDLELAIDLSLLFDGDLEQYTERITLAGELVRRPTVYHGVGSFVFDDPDGYDLDEAAELYARMEDGALALYFKTEADEEFCRLSLPVPQDALGLLEQAALTPLDWALSEQDDVWILTHTLTEAERDEALAWIWAHVEQLPALLDAIGIPRDYFVKFFSGVTVQARVDRQSFELRELSADLSEGTRQLLEYRQSELGVEDELDFTDVRFLAALRLHDYGGVAPITLPAEYEDLGDVKEQLEELIGAFGEDQEGLIALDDEMSLDGYDFRFSETGLQEFLDQGWQIAGMTMSNPETAATKAPLLQPGDYCTVYLDRESVQAPEDAAMYLAFENKGSQAAPLFELSPYCIEVNQLDRMAAGAEPISLIGPRGICFGMSSDEARELLGDPMGYDPSDKPGEGESGARYMLWYGFSGNILGLFFDGEGRLAIFQYAAYLPVRAPSAPPDEE